MQRTWIVPALLIVTAIAGCMGGGGKGSTQSGTPTSPGPTTTPTSGPSPTPTDEPPAVKAVHVRILNYTREPNTSRPINVSWVVEFTGDGVEPAINSTEVHWNLTAHPARPVNESNPYVYTNESVRNQNGSYNATINRTVTGDVYFRVRVDTAAGDRNWSDEVKVTVAVAITGVVHTININKPPPSSGTSVPGSFSPATLTIALGDGVKWKNNFDAGTLSMQVESDADAAAAFDTGSIAPGATSPVTLFIVAGSYGYHETSFEPTMAGDLTVS